MNKKGIFNKNCLILFAMILFFNGCKKEIKEFTPANRNAIVFPEYSNEAIPPNIAPLNFIIKEKGNDFVVNIYSKNGSKIQISQSSPKIEIPIKKWHRLLNQNRGNNLFIDIYVKNQNWTKYTGIKDSIVNEEIDNCLVYRIVHAVYTYSREMGIYQRNLENFNETPIFVNSSADYACVNCHSFAKNSPSKMVMHFRKEHPGTLIYDSGILKKLTTKTPYTMSGGIYPSWHPDSEIIAFPVLKMAPIFTSRKEKIIDLADIASDIAVYDVKKNIMTTSPKVSTFSRENLPTWSPDGKWIYFISAPQAKKGDLESLLHVKYDLLRIPYDIKTNTWGDIDTVLSSKKTGMSITFPSFSPDGKYLLFTMTDYGYFSIYHQNSDLYLLDLTTHEYKKMNINSNCAESHHTWSSNGRWIVFSSKRLDNIYTRPFIAYFDEKGNSYKPFLLPQKDPEYYDFLLANYNRPELLKSKVELSDLEIRDFIYTEPQNIRFDNTVDIDALSGASKIVSNFTKQ
jgi:Tol biopolymer transport system component